MAVLLCAAMAAAWVLAGPAAAPQVPLSAQSIISNGPVGILYPPDNSVLSNDKLAILVITPNSTQKLVVKLDGKPLEAERITFARMMALRGTRLYASTRPADIARAAIVKDAGGKSIWVAAAQIEVGSHLIEAEGAQVRIFFGGATTRPVHDSSIPFYLHGYTKGTVINACQQCHSMSKEGEARVLGVSDTPASCQNQGCHDEVGVQLTHRHVLDSISKCYICHDPHGSSGAMLLVDTQEKLCTQCHEGGHSKR